MAQDAPMFLPYVDAAPAPRYMTRARDLVRCESERACSAGPSAKAAAAEQCRAAAEFDALRRAMGAVRRRPRSDADCEPLRFEALLQESLEHELRLRGGGGGALAAADADAALAALQDAQEALRATRRRIDEVNATRCAEQRQCAAALEESARLAARRRAKIEALRRLLRSRQPRDSLLRSLEN